LSEDHIARDRLIIWISVAAVLAAGASRYFQAPSFWLDDAFVAVSLRDPTPASNLAPLSYGQYFPRIYLAVIAELRQLLGYHIWVLRLLPFLFFVVATIVWARLLAKRSGSLLPLAVLSAALLLGCSFWLDESIHLKQYTLDTLAALIPFAVGDDFFENTLANGKRKSTLMLLAIPCSFSYVYPIALGGRVIGWYIHHGRFRGWRIRPTGAFMLIVAVTIGLGGIWFTDHRFNLRNQAAYMAYWNTSILGQRFEEGIGSGLGLIANFIWGWHHGRLMPLVIAAVAPLQALGIYRVVNRWIKREGGSDAWGSRTLGSLAVLAGAILASGLIALPISAGRLVLFAQIHTQILALEGALFILSSWSARKAALIFLYAAVGIVVVYSTHRYLDFIRTEPIENIRPMLPLINRELADTILVHPCSVAQVESLPEPLPVARVVLDTKRQAPHPGQKAWVLWTNLSDDHCRQWMDVARSSALSWQVIHEGPGRGLALAEF
jgi:hypothetical protein